MTFQPIGDNILVRREVDADISAGGLHIPGEAKEKSMRGTVVAMGGGAITLPLGFPVAPGDFVMFRKFAGIEVKMEGVDHVFLLKEDILAVQRKDEP